MRYFDKDVNMFGGMDMHNLHDKLGTASMAVESNIVYRLLHADDDGGNLAASAYNVIAVCEAIIDTLPEDVTAKAIAEVNKDMLKHKRSKERVKALFDILVGGDAL